MTEKTNRSGDWQQTFSGRAFWAMDPKSDDIDIRDIAHALSLQCRYAGHCRVHYSVAQHSLLVVDLIQSDEFWDMEQRLEMDDGGVGGDVLHKTALLHDAAEAYLVDVPRPIKPYLAGYKEIENGLAALIAHKYDTLHPLPSVVKTADNMALAIERDAFFSVPPRPWPSLPEPTDALRHLLVPGMVPSEVEQMFLQRFWELMSDGVI